MIKNIESGIYDGIFFHRVIDDFVTQSGDPTCKTTFFYLEPNLQCGSGGTGTTIPLEHDENLSHVDGAIGMARSQEEDSADSQWYIPETEAHNLDPENRDDGGYATFGIVRNGMSHVTKIATVPTSDDPTGNEDIQNPASSAGRPVNEVLISSVTLTGVSDPDGTLRFGPQDSEDTGGFFALVEEFYAVIFTSTFLIGAVILLAGWMFARIDTPLSIEDQDKDVSLDAMLLDETP